MKKTQIIAVGVIILGLLCKFMHWPGGSILLIIGTLLLYIYSCIFLFNNEKEKIHSIYNFLVTLITTYILFRIQFWPSSKMIFFIVISLGLVYLFFQITRKSYNRKNQMYTF